MLATKQRKKRREKKMSKLRSLTDDKCFIVEEKNGIIFVTAIGDKEFKLDLSIPVSSILAVHMDGNKVNISTVVVDRFHSIWMRDYRHAEALKAAIDAAMVSASAFIRGVGNSAALQSSNATLPKSPKEAKSS